MNEVIPAQAGIHGFGFLVRNRDKTIDSCLRRNDGVGVQTGHIDYRLARSGKTAIC